jgi:hypothetical protein
MLQFRRRYEEYAAQREADRIAREVERAARVKGSRGAVSEGHWFYQEGLRLRQTGDAAGAERVWRDLVTAFRDVPSERAWVLLAERELNHPGEAAPAEVRWAAVRESLDAAERLRLEGKIDDAKRVCQAIEDLYRDDPSAKSILDEVRTLRLKLGE